MTKFLDYIDRNAIKIALTAILIFGVFLGCLYVYTIKADISRLRMNVIELFGEQMDSQEEVNQLTFQGLLLIIEQLEDVAKTQQYIIDQNRDKVEKELPDKKSSSKPTYEALKAHTVYIVGCSDKKLSDDKKIQYMLGEEEGVCWSGTGFVVKETDTETFIATNNHVSGLEEKNVTLYVQNEQTKLIATVVKHNPTVDIAVIKVEGKLIGKKPITKIASAKIQDSVYVVGNPLLNKMTYSEGVVANFIGKDMLIQAPLIFGNSGSAIYNSNGEVIGICYALQMYPGFLGIPMAQITHSLCVDSVSVKAFLIDLGLYNE